MWRPGSRSTHLPQPPVSAFGVAFSLGGWGPASLELLDVAGRRCLTGPWGHSGRDCGLAPAICSVRLSEAGRSVFMRAVLIR